MQQSLRERKLPFPLATVPLQKMVKDRDENTAACNSLSRPDHVVVLRDLAAATGTRHFFHTAGPSLAQLANLAFSLKGRPGRLSIEETLGVRQFGDAVREAADRARKTSAAELLDQTESARVARWADLLASDAPGDLEAFESNARTTISSLAEATLTLVDRLDELLAPGGWRNPHRQGVVTVLESLSALRVQREPYPKAKAELMIEVESGIKYQTLVIQGEEINILIDLKRNVLAEVLDGTLDYFPFLRDELRLFRPPSVLRRGVEKPADGVAGPRPAEPQTTTGTSSSDSRRRVLVADGSTEDFAAAEMVLRRRHSANISGPFAYGELITRIGEEVKAGRRNAELDSLAADIRADLGPDLAAQLLGPERSAAHHLAQTPKGLGE